MKYLYNFWPLRWYIQVLITLPLFMYGTTLAKSNDSSSDIKWAEKKLELLGQAIQNYQKTEVWPGGNKYNGCYMWAHRKRYLNNGGAKKFADAAKRNTVFIQGAKALNYFAKHERFSYYRKWEKPVYPTWATLGKICPQGTTDAGYITQKEIAKALVNLIKDMYLHPKRYEIKK